jgi:hypothetical protein
MSSNYPPGVTGMEPEIMGEVEWATVETPAKLDLSNNCSCDDIEEGCDGDVCYFPIKEDFEEAIFAEFLKRNDNPNYLKVAGKKVGWRGVSGYTVIKADFKELFEAMTFNGDWTLRITLADTNLSIVRSSHDEPMGAPHTITPFKVISDVMTLDEAIKKNLVDEYGCHKICGARFDDCDCEQV